MSDLKPPNAGGIPAERDIGGLRCGQVLERLGDYVDGDLDADAVAQVGVHLAGCDNCARFGAHYAAVVNEVRVRLSAAPGIDDKVRSRLWDRLDKEL